jgi:hypothetical protein
MQRGPQPRRVHAGTHLSGDSEATATRRVLDGLEWHCAEELAGVERAPQRRASKGCAHAGPVHLPLLQHVVRLEHASHPTLPLLVRLSLDAPRSFTSMCMMLTVPNWKSAAGALLPAQSGADWVPAAQTT